MRRLPPLDKADLETKRAKAQQGQGNVLRARPRSETRGEERSRREQWVREVLSRSPRPPPGSIIYQKDRNCYTHYCSFLQKKGPNYDPPQEGA